MIDITLIGQLRRGWAAPCLLSCVVFFLVGLVFFSGTATAQSSEPLKHAIEAYEALDFGQARSILATFIERPSRATTADLAHAHLLLGIIEFSENGPEAARPEFTSAIQLQREIRPDPTTVSPKIVEFFDSVKSSLATRPSAVETRYVTIVDQRPAAALRSMLLPGWGQYYKGDRTKAFIAGASWFAAAGATAVAHGVRRRARIRYTDETDADLVGERYASFNRAHKIRNTLAASAAAVWLIAYVDALATPGRRLIAPLELTLAPAPGGATVRAIVAL